MNKNIVDTRGMQCPKPLIMTKKALDDPNINDELVILVDNEISCENIERFLTDNKVEYEIVGDDEIKKIVISKSGDLTIEDNPEHYCSVPEVTGQGNVICFRNNYMGEGPEELGEILVKAFINTIKEVKPLPSSILMYNNGVLLAKEGSLLIDTFKELEKLGVKILVCGTCADYFSIKDKIKVGLISNMYDILDKLSNADKIIYP